MEVHPDAKGYLLHLDEGMRTGVLFRFSYLSLCYLLASK